jgi:hypothetical protein
MTTANDRILIQIVTAANMAGVDAAKAGFLGLAPPALALAAILGLAIFVGKAAVANYNDQQAALNGLKQAVDAYNESAGKMIPTTDAQAAAIAKATDAEGKALESLTISQNAVSKAQLTYDEAVKKHGPTSDAARNAYLPLADAQMRAKTAQEALADSQTALTAAQTAAIPVMGGTPILLSQLNDQFDRWLNNNKQYVPNQYDARDALAAAVRAGNDQIDSMRMLNDSLDLATIKHEDVSAAMQTLILAEAGNAKGLKALGITTAEYNAIMKSTLSDADKHAALMALIETHTKDGRKATDDMSSSQKALNTNWQNFTSSIGPGVTTGLGDIYRLLDFGVQKLEWYRTFID